jgi:hypothetical protein
MAQIHLHSDTLVCRIGGETTFGTTASTMKRLVLTGPQIPLAGLKTEMLPVADLSPHMEDARSPVRGLARGGQVAMKLSVKRIATRLTSSATPVAYSNSSALSHQILLRHWLGGEHVDAGSTLASSATSGASTVTVASGHGSRFAVGCMIGIVEDAAGLRPYLVTSVSTDTIGIYPNLRGDAASGAVIANSYTYHRSEAHTGPSLTVEQAQYEPGTPAAQRRARGVYGSCKLTLAVGQQPVLDFTGESSAEDGPGDLSIPLTAAADDMGPYIGAWTPEVLFQTGASFTASYVCDSLELDVPNAWQWVTQGDGVGARNGAVRVNGKSGPPTWTLKLRMDAAEYTAFTADTSRYLMVWVTSGTGTSARIFGALIARAAMAEEPAQVIENGLVFVTLKGVAMQDTATAGSPVGSSSTDLSRSPVRLFLI